MERKTVPDNGEGRISIIGVYQRIRELRDISLHGNRGIIDREVCSTRQIDGRGEKDEIEWKLERLKDNGDRGRGTTTASRKSEIFLPFSPGTPDLFSLLLCLAMRTIFIRNCICLCCVLFARWIRMLEFNSRSFHPLDIECCDIDMREGDVSYILDTFWKGCDITAST